jgi:hypothetical protein
MADNAPNSSQFAPYPNLVCKIAPKKIEMHVLTFTGANGSAAMLQTLSSAGCTVTYNSEGDYSFTFPLGGTGAVGWVQICPPVQTGIAVTDGRFYALDSDVLNFATGVGRFAAFDGSATPALADVIGTLTLLIYVVKA